MLLQVRGTPDNSMRSKGQDVTNEGARIESTAVARTSQTTTDQPDRPGERNGERGALEQPTETSTSSRVMAAARALEAELDPSRVVLSGPAYEEARRVWNGAVDHRPALVVRGGTPADVQAAIRAARAHRLPVSVRGGGHDWAGRAVRHGGLVVDLSAMRRVVVDPEARVATVAGGAT